MAKVRDGEMIATAHLRRVEIWRAVCEIIATAFNRLAAHDEEIKRLRWQMGNVADMLKTAIYSHYVGSEEEKEIVARLEAIATEYKAGLGSDGEIEGRKQ